SCSRAATCSSRRTATACARSSRCSKASATTRSRSSTFRRACRGSTSSTRRSYRAAQNTSAIPPQSRPRPKPSRTRRRPSGSVVLYDLGEHRVQTIGDDFYVAPSASVIGRVYLGRHANVWFGAVMRGDVNDIRIGDDTNVQDTAVIHVDADAPCTIGRGVTIGHGAVVHGCTVGDFSLIGIGATILSHAVIGSYCLVGAGALV